MKRKIALITVALLVIALAAGCGARAKAGEFNDYFAKVSKNMAALKKTNDELAKAASVSPKAEDLTGLNKILADDKLAIKKVINDYNNTKEPAELTKYKEAAINNLNKRIKQVELIESVLGYIGKLDYKNPALAENLAQLNTIEKEINDNDKKNNELLQKIAKDNKLTIKSDKDKILFEVKN